MACVEQRGCLTNMLSTSLHCTFIAVTALYLIIHSIVRRCGKKNTGPKIYYRFPGHIIRWIVTLTLILVQTFGIAEGFLTVIVRDSIHNWVEYVLPLLSLAGTIAAGVLYSHIESQHKVRLLLALLLYWITSWTLELLGVIHLWTDYELFYKFTKFYIGLITLVFHLILAIIEVYALKYWKSKKREKVREKGDIQDLKYQHNEKSFLSQFTLNWMNPFLAYGFRHTLNLEDLGTMPMTENVQENFKKLKEVFMQEKARCGGDKEKASLWLCLWKAYWPLVALAGLFKLLSDQLLFVSPVCVDFMVAYVVDYLSREDITDMSRNITSNQSLSVELSPLEVGEFFSNGYVLCLITLMSTLLYAILWQNNFFLSSRQGVRCKGALQALVFDKTLRLSTHGMTEGGTTQGQIVNHMTVDPLNIFMFFYLGHFAWTLPIQVLTGFVLLYLKLGVSALISGLIIVMMVPVQYYIGVCLARVQKQIMVQADDRLKRTNEVFQSIKLLKLYAWEKMFTDGITETREKELKLLLKAGLLRVCSILVTDGAPVSAALITFCLYPHLEEKPLDAGKVFSGMALFAILSIPLFLITIVMNGLSHALVSVRRLRNFLFALEIEGADDSEERWTAGNGDAPSVKYTNGSALRDGSHNPEQQGLLNESNIESGKKVPEIVIEEATEVEESLDGDDDVVVEVIDGCYAWDANTKQPIISDLNFSIKRGELTVIVGPVGSGKSSILSALLGEMTTVSGSIKWNKMDRLAYVHQNAWIMNSTLRENILFGKPLDRTRYERVLEACALKPDLEILIAGDLTEIGEKGVNLSGGQKQRVSLARAVYSDVDAIVMDDPLSALDAHVGQHVFKEVITDILLKEGKSVLLVTHQVHFLPQADKIIVISEGKISCQGSYEDVIKEVPNLIQTLVEEEKHLDKQASKPLAGPVQSLSNPDILVEYSSSVGGRSCHMLPEVNYVTVASVRSACSMTSLHYVGENEESAAARKLESHHSGVSKNSKTSHDPTVVTELGKLIEEEERASGSVSYRYYLHYFKAASWWLSMGTILLYIVRQAVRIGSDVWLAGWAEASQRHADTRAANDKIIAQNLTNVTLQTFDYDLYNFMSIYGVFIAFSILTCGLAILLLELMVVFAAKNLHKAMLAKIVYAPMRFFDTTPIGRIINRFSGDTNMIDEKMATAWDTVLFCLVYVVGGIAVNSFTTPVFILPALLMFILYVAVQRFYIASSRELHRIDNITKSPILAHFSETLGGLTTVRAYKVEKQFQKRNLSYIESNNTACLFRETAHVWMGIRLDSMGAFIVFAAGISSITSGIYGVISPGIVGLAIAYAIMISSFLNWLMRGASELEMWFNAVERVVYYTEVDTEPPVTDTTETVVPEEWPRQGGIRFENVSLRYDASLPPVVKCLNLQMLPGQRVGICGRTGSGKSSLTLSLFRMVDIFEGRILIDDLDIARVPLQRLRSGLSIIPQDPVLFSGSVRYNLDPDSSCTDVQIWQALEISQLKGTIQDLPQKLESVVTEGGENFSVGQRQLFCLARAFLRHSKILIMDEATASIDLETDQTIQKVIQTAFEGRTVLIIAHRIRTIINCDSIVVLRDGQVIEHDSPKNLMSNESGHFSMMLKQNT